MKEIKAVIQPFQKTNEEHIVGTGRFLTISRLILAVFMLGIPAVLGAQGPAKKSSISLEGEIVDVACYMGHRVPSSKHPKCTKSCLMDGTPIGLLAADDLYLLLEDGGNPKAYQTLKQAATERVKARGIASTRGGLRTLTVQEVTVLKEAVSGCTEQVDPIAPEAGYCGG